MSLKNYIYDKPVINTERLTLRPLIPSDADDLSEWTPDKSLYAYWGKRAGKADKKPMLMFDRAERPSKSFHWGVVENESGKVVGELWIYLIEGDRMAKIATRFAKRVHGRGYATEAARAAIDFCFANTELQRIWTDVDVNNIASCRVLEKLGFSREGLIRGGKMVSVWCDYYIYGLLKSDTTHN